VLLVKESVRGVGYRLYVLSNTDTGIRLIVRNLLLLLMWGK